MILLSYQYIQGHFNYIIFLKSVTLTFYQLQHYTTFKWFATLATFNPTIQTLYQKY